MTPNHHPGDDILAAYAAGVLDEQTSLVVASHATLCPICRQAIRDYEQLGGALLAEEPQVMRADDDDVFATLMQRVDQELVSSAPQADSARRPTVEHFKSAVLPSPLRAYIGGDIDAIKWRFVMPGLEEMRLTMGEDGADARMLRIKAGRAMLRHTHHGDEFTQVFTGGFTDHNGHYVRGDVSITDPSVDHQPVADRDGDCICLAVVGAPLQLTGPIGRFLNPLVRY
jgi:putative transcriptional regulator